MLTRVRAYARQHARRHFLVCDAHTPTGGYVEDGKLLFDFHSFPLRIVEVADQPHNGELKVGYTDAIFTKSKGGLTPSGWSCEHLPYVVEFDNFGRSRQPGQPSKSPFTWGWDEITWFALTPENERNDWLRYAWKWVKDTDPNGHLQMPGSRVLHPVFLMDPAGIGRTREATPAQTDPIQRRPSRTSGERRRPPNKGHPSTSIGLAVVTHQKHALRTMMSSLGGRSAP
jgi:hypothetical protein